MQATNRAVQAVGAAAGFAAQTGMHAADTGERAAAAAESALEAGKLNTEALLAAQYTIEANRIIAENYAPHSLEVNVGTDLVERRRAIKRLKDSSGVIIESRAKVEGGAVELPVADAPGVVFASLEIASYFGGGLQERWWVNVKDSVNGAFRIDIPVSYTHLRAHETN